MGIDPGSRKAGYGIVGIHGRKITYIASGVMRYDGVPEFIDRLGHIYNSCTEIVAQFGPQEIAIESLIYVKSISSLSKLAQARGAMIAALMKTHQQRVFEYSPNLIKSVVTGHGHATKESVDKALGLYFGALNFQTNDESDALAIAVCHALERGHRSSVGLKNIGIGRSEKRTLKSVFKDRI